MAWSLSSYEAYIYSVRNLSSYIQASNLVFIRRGKFLAEVEGSIIFDKDISLEVRENLSFRDDAFIRRYGYLVKKGADTLYWYDSQPHPNNPELQSTHPHHKHIPPDIKHHRIPAPELSFEEPNLTFLIREIESQYFASQP
ncbi:MAG: toxin-antitoxin system TumE family protein [bacterium]